MNKILISDKLGAAGLERLDAQPDVEWDMRTDLSVDQLRDVVGQYDALIVRSGTTVDRALLDRADNLKAIARAGIGVDNIDLDAARQRGIPVMNTPSANAVATAEQTMCLMLAVSRHTAPSHASVLRGEWRRADFVGVQLEGKTLGIIGFGRIGRLVGERARAFGMKLIAFDPYVSPEDGRAAGAEMLELVDVLSQADYLTLHAIVTEETEHLINAETLARVNPGAIIVNVARGKLIDEAALADALRDGRLAAAAIDVYEHEPPDESPLIGLPNVLHTPHLGASTVEAQRAVATEAVDAVLAVLKGQPARNVVNGVEA